MEKLRKITDELVKDFIFIPDIIIENDDLTDDVYPYIYHFEGLGILKLRNTEEIIVCEAMVEQPENSAFKYHGQVKSPSGIVLDLYLKMKINCRLRENYKLLRNLLFENIFTNEFKSDEELRDYWIKQHDKQQVRYITQFGVERFHFVQK